MMIGTIGAEYVFEYFIMELFVWECYRFTFLKQK